jgi:hypothetical protein
MNIACFQHQGHLDAAVRAPSVNNDNNSTGIVQLLQQFSGIRNNRMMPTGVN